MGVAYCIQKKKEVTQSWLILLWSWGHWKLSIVYKVAGIFWMDAGCDPGIGSSSVYMHGMYCP